MDMPQPPKRTYTPSLVALGSESGDVNETKGGGGGKWCMVVLVRTEIDYFGSRSIRGVVTNSL